MLHLEAENSENPSCAISVRDEVGNVTEIMHVNCNIRPGRGFYMGIDVFDRPKVEEYAAEVKAQLNKYAAEVFKRAADEGIPTPDLGGDTDA